MTNTTEVPTPNSMERTKRFAQVKVIFFLCFSILQASSVMAQKTPIFSNRPSNPAVEIQSSLTLPQMIEELGAHYPFDPAYLTRVLAVQFMENSAIAKGFYFDGDTAVRLADSTSVVHVDWRSQTHPDDKNFKPTVYFKIQGTCFTKAEITNHFGDIFLIWGPNARLPEGKRRWGYLKKIEKAFLVFSFSADDKCLTSFGFRPSLTDRELKTYISESEKDPIEASKVISTPKP
jgi:hypothetical protein